MANSTKGYRVRFAALRVAIFPRWRSAPAWRVRCGYQSSSPDVQGYCDDARRVIWISPGLTGNELDVMIVHEIVHAVAGPGHARRFVARLRRAADAARDHGLAALAEALRTEAAAYESTPPMRARDVYLDIEDAAWQGAPLGAVAAGRGLTLAEMLRRYPRARSVHDAARKAAEQALAIPGWSRTPEGPRERTGPPPGLRVCDVLMIEQRNVWRRFELAPEDIPDPFGQQWWTLMQVLAWVYRRDPAVVRLVAPPEPFETTFTIKDLRVLGRNGACYPRIENAGDAVIEALQAGRLTATGFLDGEGDRNEIPPLSWVDLVFRFEPYYFAGPKGPSRTVPYWNDLRFQRKDVLAVWPDSLESPAMADEQKTSTTAEGKERPVQRRARITARHQGLKAAGDPHPTKTIAEEEGISRRRVLQVMENKPKANEAPPTRPIPKAR